ncbi:hypothetical protein RYX36_012432 [Vicia faba]
MHLDSATVLSSYPDSGGLGCGYVMNRWGFTVGSVSMALGDGVADERSSPRVKKAYDLLESTPDAFMLQQFSNPANTQVHFETTGPEIWEDTNGQVDIFVMGIGSGGTVSGVGQYLKSRNPNVKIYGVEPSESNVLNGGKPGPHHITGNGVGFKLDILDMDVMDKVLEVSSEDAVNMARTLALKEGLMVTLKCQFCSLFETRNS